MFYEQQANAMRLAALNPAAERLGLTPGQSLAEARAMQPDLQALPLDRMADRGFLEALADWCGRYTPLVSLDPHAEGYGLFLDITGCAHLFGGEKSLLADLLQRLERMGVEAKGAIAPTPGLAWAMARFCENAIVQPGEEGERLHALPLKALRLPSELLLALARVGLTRVGEVMEAPRAPLSRRFGPLLLLRLDQALGAEEEPLSPRLPPADFSSERRLAEPIVGEDHILEFIRHLAESLKRHFDEKKLGGRLFELLLFRVDGRVFRLSVGTAAALTDPVRIAGLFRERLQAVHDDLDAGFGFEILRLSALTTESREDRQQDLSGRDGAEGQSLSDFIDQAMARLGRDSLERPGFAESHIPERASSFTSAVDARKNTASALPHHLARLAQLRPLRLLVHPEAVEAVAEVPEGPPMNFRWRRALHRVARAEGPERIAAEWWLDGEEAQVRDYFRVEDMEGRRFWLFREGLFGGDISPRWYLHGFFA
ncbi:protein ImuB [Rhizobium paknamense]|uniref:Protein ImuB n=1 Tax=Rhizobium paknamense TaxID=1206817 RepID=A0ABU0II50_9HYPH|nr:protein ImuB [Rhizobium paknamense]